MRGGAPLGAPASSIKESSWGDSRSAVAGPPVGFAGGGPPLGTPGSAVEGPPLRPPESAIEGTPPGAPEFTTIEGPPDYRYAKTNNFSQKLFSS
ncbi:hypothetical protein ACSSS7_003347 [Eimeria intestinalis]